MATETLRSLWQEISGKQPGRFPSEIARDLGVSEAELLASRVGQGVTRLVPRWHEMLNGLGSLGMVKSVTRNEHAVIEKNGVYPEFQHGAHALFVSENIDLRITLGRWAFAFAVDTGASRSIQFFGSDGAAVHKVFLTKDSSLEEFYEIIAGFQDENQQDTQAVEPAPGTRSHTSGDAVDCEAFLAGWSELQDTHHFFSLLHKHKLARPQALRLAEGGFTRRVPNSAARLLIEQASLRAVPLMVFVGNLGCLQIHKGLLRNVVDFKGWLNVMDPEVELHLKESEIARAWVVEKPTSDARIFSLELFDAVDRDIASFFGVRQEGGQQEQRWRDLLGSLPAVEVRT